VTYDPETRTTSQLLSDWAAIMRQLRVRDVVRTNNNPVGDIAEAIVAAHYDGERGSFSQAGWDVKTPAGERIQVKSLRQTATGKRSNLSPIRDADYDSVVIVIFDEDFRVTEGLKLAREVVEDLFEHRPYVNGRIITVTARLRADKRIETLELAPAAQGLNA
jgi:5S rRNA maturation endonuclease (ribonuclease M5)